MFCPNCGTQNPETAATCTKCGFALKSAAPKFKGTMLMQGAPPNMQALRDATAGAPPPAAGAPPAPSPAVGAGAGNVPPSRLKGTIVGVAAQPRGAAPAPPTATGAGAPAAGGGFPGTLA
ncbi:MAG: zinc ribbon domain-containing protein [Labilithrix sp.]|nr:zinc ribbon domain-containing protein [Labilithrix sp.]